MEILPPLVTGTSLPPQGRSVQWENGLVPLLPEKPMLPINGSLAVLPLPVSVSLRNTPCPRCGAGVAVSGRETALTKAEIGAVLAGEPGAPMSTSPMDRAGRTRPFAQLSGTCRRLVVGAPRRDNGRS